VDLSTQGFILRKLVEAHVARDRAVGSKWVSVKTMSVYPTSGPNAKIGS
jgi:hypothetical protein